MSLRPRIAILFAVSLASSFASAQTVYVDDSATGANDGTSWVNAHVDLQTALSSASAGTTIWVGEGMYRPAPFGGSSAARFVIGPGVRLYGSFAGFETSIAQRDIAAHRSILSGDLSGNDGPNFANRLDNCARVVEMTGPAGGTVLDGFVVEGANTTGPFDPNAGGGIGVIGPARIENCWIRDNRNSSSGGGMLSFGGGLQLIACVIEGNEAWFGGGGIYWQGGRMEHCSVRRNRSLSQVGGGVEQQGTALYSNCEFIANRAHYGGALYGVDFTDGLLVGSTIFGNITTHPGSANVSVVSLDVANSIAWDNNGVNFHATGGALTATTQGTGFGSSYPRFADPHGSDGVLGTGDDDFRLLPGSPCIDSGDNSFVPTGTLFDLAGLRRFADDPDTIDTGSGTAPIVDRGAHEYRPCAPPVSFCVAAPNSVGPGALMSSSGTAKLYADDLVLRVDGCPPFAFGLFFHGDQTLQAPFGNGYRCVGGAIVRAGIVQIDATGHAELAFDAAGSLAPLAPGVARHFQYWYRNVAAGGALFNLSDGMTVRFCP